MNPSGGEGYGSTADHDNVNDPPPYSIEADKHHGSASVLVENPPAPAYEDSPYPKEPPPTYASLFGDIQQVRNESSGVGEFFKKVFVILIGTVGCTICLGFTLALPISMIVIGSIYINDCPAERFIPLFLIIGGSFGLVKNIMNLCTRARRQRNPNDEDEEQARPNALDSLISCFLMAWFIAGCVWVYRIYPPQYSPGQEGNDWCNKTVYLFAFVVINFALAVLAFTCCCMGCLAACFGMQSQQ